MNRPDPIDVPAEVLDPRRSAVFEALGDGVMVLPAAPVQYASRDSDRPYAPDRELYYVTGAVEPETVAVLVGGDEPSFTLFARDRDEEAELWSGPRLGVNGANERFRPDECLPLAELGEKLPTLLWRGDRLFYRLGRGGAVEAHVLEALARARTKGPRTGTGPRSLIDPGEILDELRLRKDPYEVEAIRRAVAISVEGHRAAAAAIGPGVGEWAVEAAIERAFRADGGSGPAYEPIVAAGRNACVLHYVANRVTIGEEDLVLVDAGAQWNLYAGDITRTYPADGTFTGPQRDVYRIVDEARSAAIDAVKPGTTVERVHAAAAEVLVDGLVALGVLTGAVQEILAELSYKKYYPHQTSHWLGLDVHDPGDYARSGDSRVLEPGMVFTVEPGLYFRPGVTENAGFSGIGIRIEDDVLVTDGGCEVLTAALPTSAEEVEALVGGGL